MSRSYNNFRVTEQDLFPSGPPNASWPPCKPEQRTVESVLGECPTLPEATSEMSLTPMIPSPLVDQKPITVELIDEEENDLSIDNPTEPEEKPSAIHKEEGTINRKRKWVSANELALFGSMKQLNLNIAILKRRKVLTNTTLCAVCEKQVATTPRSFALHAGTKHMDLCSYRCAICQYGASIKGNVIKHIKHHASTDVTITVPLDHYIEANLITIPFTKQQCDKIKDMIETCFSVKSSERV
ncbi:hypothetical protein GCK32_014817 [Trichostrongylus colubriformis]|uniref:C2H2-type domain-containing protein n=1 Tax=Trichostrongylus colubriformis TaxID=6319 RepID=A0AAN8EQI1_TRICO